MTRSRCLKLLLLASSALACNNDNTREHPTVRQDTSARVSSTDSRPGHSQNPTGPVIVRSDSSGRGTRIEVKSDTLIVQLPKKIAELLFDSLPAFTPFSRQAYDSSTVALAERDSTIRVPSVVVGDFDGDGLSDVAMIGISRDSEAEVMLLTNQNGGGGPRLLFMTPLRPTDHSGKSEIILRPADQRLIPKEPNVRRDGVEEVWVGKGAVVFYVDRGVLRQIQTGD